MNALDIDHGMKALVLIDQDIARAYKQLGVPPERHRPKGFETFLSAIVSQQISTKAAHAIFERVIALMPEVTAKELLSVDDQALRDAGLSWRKIEYAKGLAEAIESGSFDIEELDSLSITIMPPLSNNEKSPPGEGKGTEP